MPTSSQWGILKVLVAETEAKRPVQEDIASKLAQLEADEDDLFGLHKLKSRIEDAQEKKSTNPKEGKSAYRPGSSGSNNKQPIGQLPGIPKRMKNKLFGMGFRNSDGNMKKKLAELEEVNDISKDDGDTDDIIKEILLHQNVSMMPKKMRKEPDMKPRAVCFNYPGSNLTHLEVKRAMDKFLVPFPEIKMTTIEFYPRFKLLRPDKMENTCRWVINFNTEWGRCRMTNRELDLRGIRVQTKRYDEIVALEYKQFDRMTEILKIVKNT